MENNKLDKNKILLGLSGGVDSTAAALLLKEKGFEVTGYYFDVLGNNEQGKAEAQAVADQLGIELICEDVSAEFSEKVIGNFCGDMVCIHTDWTVVMYIKICFADGFCGYRFFCLQFIR